MQMLRVIAVSLFVVGIIVAVGAMATNPATASKGCLPADMLPAHLADPHSTMTKIGRDAYLRSDYAKAMQCMRELAEHGDATAMYNLGVMHHAGKGVPEDYVKAYMWYNLASIRKIEIKHKNLLDELDALDAPRYGANHKAVADELSASGIETALRLSRECLARNYRNC